ncbi:class I SAM-dependent methyltransferase [Cryobacterium frigoriphilum]|uniref:Class I SAM-dependent methyltransferase n=1 Tax=Cryobacterium frigoriphilum TaxID=1259150 RepID=A0A4R8ZWA5_9MICO|nr:class I SAM-dependent methyltransferase [Cryobacterium frigoriphilum]TFD47863.1 class I SAM-dependent methyltransferase [Cryobacterium frigoriphilum]
MSSAPFATSTGAARIHWTEAGVERSALWRSESGFVAPTRVAVVDDTLTADAALRLIKAGTGLLWRGDYHNARQLLQALGRRIDGGRRPKDADLTQAFRRHRTEAARRAELLGLLLVPLDADLGVALRRAPDVREACAETWGAPSNASNTSDASEVSEASEASVTSLRELIGIVGAHEWRRKGVAIPALDDRIHAHYGVFSPVRGEYLDLVATAPLPEQPHALVAFDIGTGTGVIAAILARRGVAHVVGTDQSPRAIACARDNLARLDLDDRVEVVDADLFPTGRADLVVCNPPWIPASAVTATDHAVYDPDSRMLRGFLGGLADHLLPHGEGWLIISDIAERLGLRSRSTLLDLIDAAGLTVVSRLDTRPTHPRAADPSDPLHAARAAEVTSLWRLAAAVPFDGL